MFEVFELEDKYKEILKLNKKLDENQIPHELFRLYDGWKISYPSLEKEVCSVVEHFGSYGNTLDKLEIMGLLTYTESKMDSVVGSLTASNVFKRILKHYEKGKNE